MSNNYYANHEVIHKFYKGGFSIYEIFIGKIAEQKALRGLTNADIGKMTGYKRKTIDAFTGGSRQSDNVAGAIAKVLNIEL